MKTYSIFGAGAAGLYTAWRLLNGDTKNKAMQAKQLKKGDTLELVDWGQYDMSQRYPGSRAAGARVCTWHYCNDKNKSYLELGGMRYSEWNAKDQTGHLLVTTVIKQLGLDKYAVPFNESDNPLLYLRAKNMYTNAISQANPAPYNVQNNGADSSPYTGFNIVESLAVTASSGPTTRLEWCQFYRDGRISADLPETSVFKKGELLKDIGYWNLMYDQLGSEGFNYTADGNGYTSNIINWNAAVAFNANNEFAPGTAYKTLTTGYSSMFNALFDAIVKLAEKNGVKFDYQPNTRLHSILQIDGVIHYALATRADPTKKSVSKTCAAAWLAMPRFAIDLVAQATRFESHQGLDVLNHQKVQLYLESAIMQPSYKVGMFFDTEWWLDPNVVNPATYPPQLESYEITPAVLSKLGKAGFSKGQLNAIQNNDKLFEQPVTPAANLIAQVELCLEERLSIKHEQALLTLAKNNTIGPSVTDLPVRQVVYFGNNASDKKATPVYGLLASYDDETFTSFWQELELGPLAERKIPISDKIQPLIGPRKAPPVMVKMLRQQLAQIHFGPQADYSRVPEPLETSYMDWSLPPFNAGYHAWAAHYDVADVQRKIRKPSQLIEGVDADIFIVGETWSNDQAWVEGAYCTAESVLNDFFGIVPIVDNPDYPFICPAV